jgi:hypothetical protein
VKLPHRAAASNALTPLRKGSLRAASIRKPHYRAGCLAHIDAVNNCIKQSERHGQRQEN